MYFATFILKNLLRRKVRSVLTACGLGIAVTAVVALLGIADGFERSFLELYRGRGVDLMVVRAGTTERVGSSLPELAGKQIAELPGVRAVAPGLMDMISFEQRQLIGVPIQGWAAGSFLFNGLRFKSGRSLQAGDDHKVMLGIDLAGNLGKTAGDTVEIFGEDFEVVGVYESFQFENISAVVLLPDLQRMMGRPGQVTGFQVIVEDGPDKEALVERVRREIEDLHDDRGYPLGLSARPTEEYVKSLSQIKMARAMASMTSLIALIIGAIGVLNTMIMSVFERTREIGILRAMGWRQARVVRMVLAESLLLSMVGAVLGTLGAVGLIKLLGTLPDAGFIRKSIAPVVMAEGFLLALAVGLLGGLYPAFRGARLLPTEALRHE